MGANFQIMVNNIIEKFDRVRKSREGKCLLATIVDISQLVLNMGANLQIIVRKMPNLPYSFHGSEILQ